MVNKIGRYCRRMFLFRCRAPQISDEFLLKSLKSNLVSCKFLFKLLLSDSVAIEYLGELHLKWCFFYLKKKFHWSNINFIMVIGLCLRSSDVAVQYGMLLQPILVQDFLHRVMLLLFLGAGLLVLCIEVTSSFNC